MEVKFRFEGLKELDDLLKQLPAAVDNRIAGNALRAGARVIRDSVKAATPEGDSGRLKKSIRVITGKSSDRSTKVVHVGFFGKPSSLAHLIEYGTVPIRRSTSGKKLVFVVNGQVMFRDQVKGVIARPFFRPTTERTAAYALETIRRVLADQIVKEAQKPRARLR